MEGHSAAMLARWLMEERERPRQVQEDTRSRRPQIVAQHEVRMIFRFSIQSLTLALPLTKPRSRRPRVMPNAICPSGLHSLATAFCSTPRTTRFGIFLQRASQPSRPRVSPPDLRFHCFMFTEDVHSEKRQELHSDSCGHTLRLLGTNREIGVATS